MSERDIENILQTEGVNAKGYGILSQAVMFDRELTPQSKSIYAYLVSYLGSGSTIFPKRETIMADLKICKDTFYKYLKPLVDNGYIKITKAPGFKNKNVYTICNNPQKLNYETEHDSSESLLSLDGINGKGFGFIPKLIMCDRRLNIKSKALIAFFYSLVQTGCRAFPHRKTICFFLGISRDSYYTALRQLVEYNYITVKQRHTKNGRFTINDYILNSNPVKRPCPENQDTQKSPINTDNSPCPKKQDIPKKPIKPDFSPCTEKQDIINSNRVRKNRTLPCPEKQDNNNSTRYNSNIKRVSSNHQVESNRKINNADLIRTRIYELTDFENYKAKKDEFSKKYIKAVKALIEMLQEPKHCHYSNQFVKTETLMEYLNDCVTEDIWGEDSLRDLIMQVVWHYDICNEKFKIKRPFEYLKSIIWDNIRNFDL